MRLDVEARQARARRARSRSRSASTLTAAADGILRIATTKMSHVVRWVTTERGLDAADFALVAYGGAGPLHAGDGGARTAHRARSSSRARPGHFSAYGMLVADLRRDFVNTWFTPLADASFADMEEIYRRDGARRAAPAVQRSDVAVAGRRGAARGADMRYVGQEHAVTRRAAGRAVPKRGSRRHQAALRCRARDALRLFGRRPRRPRSSACAALSSALMRKPPFEHIAAGEAAPPAAAFRGTRPVYFAEAGGFVETPTYDRAALLGRQSHRRAGADRGIRLDHRRASRRRASRSMPSAISSSTICGG